MRYRLRTLLILLAVGPPMLAWLFPPLQAVYQQWRAEKIAHSGFGPFPVSRSGPGAVSGAINITANTSATEVPFFEQRIGHRRTLP
jgi:hypothetical protein